MELRSTKNTFGREVCRPLRGLAPKGDDRFPRLKAPEGGGWGSLAACGGTDCLSSNLANRDSSKFWDHRVRAILRKAEEVLRTQLGVGFQAAVGGVRSPAPAFRRGK